MTTYWQIAAGDLGRDYSEYFLRHGIAFVGGAKHVETMRSVKEGDRMILKRGTHSAMAVGEVVERNGIARGEGDREWLMDFDGWDLPAYCHVDWRRLDGHRPMPSLKRTTLQRYRSHEGQGQCEAWLEQFDVEAITPEPGPTEAVSDEQMLGMLIEEGLRPASAEELTQAFARIRYLATYYRHNLNWHSVREHETRTFLVIPLLIALGWTEQQIKIEHPGRKRQRIDVACHSKPFHREDSVCRMIIETKGFSQGLHYASGQAASYAEALPDCRVTIVTNGYCYKAFLRKEGTFATEPAAYLNILNPSSRYPVDPKETDGALELLRLLLPSTWMK